jgi:hypothetical protein
MAIFLGLTWQDIPDQVPGHYNAQGEIDRWTGKGELLITPIVGWLLFIGVTVIELFPKLWNTGVTVTEENWPRVYRVIKNMMGTMKLQLSSIFVFLTINSALQNELPSWFLPVVLIVVFGSLGYSIVRLVQIK